MTEQNTKIQDWTEQEKKELGVQTDTIFEKLPALKLEENKVTEITIDFSEKFKTYDSTNLKGEPIKKAIIPVLSDGIRMNWWLNKKNPMYRELLEAGEGKNTIIVKIMQTGTKQNTKYILVK